MPHLHEGSPHKNATHHSQQLFTHEPDKQPPSLVRQQLQSARLLTFDEEVQHAKVIRENFYVIVKSVQKIESESTDYHSPPGNHFCLGKERRSL